MCGSLRFREELKMNFIDILLAPTSGPLWGAFGVVGTAVISFLIARVKRDGDTTTAALSAINAGNKQLVEGLFQQVKVLTEEVSRLRQHTEECERQHSEKDEQLKAANDQLNDAIARLKRLEDAAGKGS